MDVYEQKKAKLRLVAGCEKIRMTMSANPIVSLNVECIMNDVDVSFQQFQRDVCHIHHHYHQHHTTGVRRALCRSLGAHGEACGARG